MWLHRFWCLFVFTLQRGQGCCYPRRWPSWHDPCPDRWDSPQPLWDCVRPYLSTAETDHRGRLPAPGADRGRDWRWCQRLPCFEKGWHRYVLVCLVLWQLGCDLDHTPATSKVKRQGWWETGGVCREGSLKQAVLGFRWSWREVLNELIVLL